MANRTTTNDMDWNEDINETDMPVGKDKGEKGGRTSTGDSRDTDETSETGWDPELTDDEMKDMV